MSDDKESFVDKVIDKIEEITEEVVEVVEDAVEAVEEFLGIGHHHDHHHHVRWFWDGQEYEVRQVQKGVFEVMADFSIAVGDPAATAAVTYVDANGDATTGQSTPVWSSSDDSVLSVGAVGDGYSASVSAVAEGSVVVSVLTTNNDGSEVVVTASVDVTGVTPPPPPPGPGAPASGTITFTPGA